MRSDNSGLGNLAREFYDNGIIDKVLIYPNGVYKSFPERFPNSRVTQMIGQADIDWLLDGIDKLLFFETPFNWEILALAKKKGIRTIIMPMHEGLNDPPEANPDLWLAPSQLEMEMNIHPKKFLTVPVNTDRVKWKLRKKAKVFVHNSGHAGIQFRNGTPELIEAMKYVKSDIKLIIRSQYHDFQTTDPRIEVRYGNVKDYWKLWDEGDVFIFPEKFNGLSLPIQEATAAGMLVMCTNRRPFNIWLPQKPMIKTDGFTKMRVARNVEVARINPIDIATKIDEFANKDISWYSEWGKVWAEQHSWSKLKQEYKNL